MATLEMVRPQVEASQDRVAQDRAARARRALRAAEVKTGVAKTAQVIPFPQRAAWVEDQTSGGWQTPKQIAQAVAQRTEPGVSVSVTGSTSTFWAVAAALWSAQDWGVVAGLPDAGLLAAAQAGIPLPRCHIVPDLGPQPLRMLAGLVDGYGLVLLGPLRMSLAQRRRIEARLRQRHALLITNNAWPGARWAVEVDQVSYSGVGAGEGSLARPQLQARLISRTGQLWDRQVAGL